MNQRGIITVGLVLTAGACEKPRSDAGTPAAVPPPSAPADSLVATAPGGVEIWFTLARVGQAADGSSCTDRTMEIRRGDRKIPIPLLYTGAPPEIVNDTTLRARLSDRCVPGDTYLVDLRTGQPVRER